MLVVEDDKDIRELLVEALAEEGYVVESVANGAEALHTLSRGSLPAAIVLDLMMPVMDGEEFRKAQLADPRLAEIPVVLLTASVDAAVKLPLSSVTATLVKPVRLDDFLAVIGQATAPAGTF